MLDDIAKVVQLISDGVTIILGGFALYGLIFKRKKLARLINVILNTQFNDRVRRTRETLSQLSNVPFDDKTRYQEGFSLLGQLRGQLRPFLSQSTEISRLHGDLVLMMEGKSRIKDVRKHTFIEEVIAAIDDISVTEYVELVKEGSESE